MKYIILIGKRNVYLKSLKSFILNNVYPKGYVLYFENIKSFLKNKDKFSNAIIFISENALHLNEFIQLCLLYGSQSVKLVTTHKKQDFQNHLSKRYKIEEFIIEIQYNGKDCFIESIVSIKHKGRYITLKTKDIYSVESFCGRVYFHTFHFCYEGKYMSIYKYEKILNDLGFIKIRKGCYINKVHVKEIRNNMIILDNDMSFFFSKSVQQKSILMN